MIISLVLYKLHARPRSSMLFTSNYTTSSFPWSKRTSAVVNNPTFGIRKEEGYEEQKEQGFRNGLGILPLVARA